MPQSDGKRSPSDTSECDTFRLADERVEGVINEPVKVKTIKYSMRSPVQPLMSPTRVKVTRANSLRILSQGRIEFLLVAGVMEGMVCKIYLGGLTNDQSWPFKK